MEYKLYCGDCLDIMPTLAKVDVVITDPPYGVHKADWDNSFPTDWVSIAQAISSKLLLMPGNTALMQAGNLMIDYKDLIVMYAVNGMTKSAIAFGNYIPVIAAGDWKWKARPNLITFTVDVSEKIDHPSPKPLSAMIKLLNHYTEQGDTILDPFMGSGTTGVACMMTGRNFIGIEINPDYFAIAEERIKKATYQPSLFQNQPEEAYQKADLFSVTRFLPENAT